MTEQESDQTAQSSDGTEHQLRREGKATYYNVYGLADDGGLEVQEVLNHGPCETYKTYECSCGRRFRKEELAAEHLRSVRTATDQSEGSQ